METIRHAGGQLAPPEDRVITSIKDLLTDVDGEFETGSTMAAKLARWRASFYMDTWVWAGMSKLLSPGR